MLTGYEVDEGINSTYTTDAQPYQTDEQMLESPWLAMMDIGQPPASREGQANTGTGGCAWANVPG